MVAIRQSGGGRRGRRGGGPRRSGATASASSPGKRRAGLNRFDQGTHGFQGTANGVVTVAPGTRRQAPAPYDRALTT